MAWGLARMSIAGHCETVVRRLRVEEGVWCYERIRLSGLLQIIRFSSSVVWVANHGLFLPRTTRRAKQKRLRKVRTGGPRRDVNLHTVIFVKVIESPDVQDACRNAFFILRPDSRIHPPRV